MKKSILLLLLSTLVISACTVDPQKAAVRRDNLINRIFPNPADQKGLYLVFPVESGGFNSSLNIIYFTHEVSQAEVMRRVASYCSQFKGKYVSGNAYLRQDSGTGTRQHSDGSNRQVHGIWTSCYKPKKKA